MVKAWNKPKELTGSFALETIVLKVLENISITDFPSGVRYVFDKAREKVKYKVPDPAGYSDDVAAEITVGSKMDAVVSALDTAYTRALAAEDYIRNSNLYEGSRGRGLRQKQQHRSRVWSMAADLRRLLSSLWLTTSPRSKISSGRYVCS
jgi:hypothetical protein